MQLSFTQIHFSFNNTLFRGIILSWLSLFSFAAFAQTTDLQIGDQAPNFSLANQDGQAIELQSYQGQWVVLYFYPKDDTPGCTTEACSFRDNINRLIKQQAVVIGVSLDSVQSHQQFSNKFQLPFDLLADTTAEVTRNYGALLDLKVIKFAKRHSFIIDPQGRVAKIYRKVDPDNHVRQVMQDLKQLQQAS